MQNRIRKNMITKEHLKTEIDKVQDTYIDVLYRIIKVFEYAQEPEHLVSVPSISQSPKTDEQEWMNFVNETYGCLADDPIERGDQGVFEKRETIL
jgi:hypothetical protein